VVVQATGGAATTTSQATVSRAAIERTQVGQDAPLLFQGLTAVTAASDAGGYSGYSYLRLRGIDQTRLTISLDGVPLNDPEDQVLYFSNVPDFLNSIQSVRIQRGVGTSGFGTASYGGSLSFESVPIATTSGFGEAQLTGGSWGTARVSLEGATGLKGGFAAYTRVSAQTTDGYRDHSGNDAYSAFLSAGWFGDRDAVKVTAFAGRSKTQLAYYLPRRRTASDRRLNPMSPDEKDDVHQEMLSVRYTRALGSSTLLTATGYRNSAGGDYDVAVGDELWNFNLGHVWYGLLSTVTWTGDQVTLTGGAHLSTYHRDHYLFIRPDLATRIYDNTGHKQEQSATNWVTGAIELHGDLELRRAAFQYQPTPGSNFGRPEIDWVFLNPKVGLTWHATSAVEAHLSVGRTSREPARTDMFAGADDVNDDLAPVVLPLDQVTPERVTDVEAGFRWSAGPRHRRTAPISGRIARSDVDQQPLRKNMPKNAGPSRRERGGHDGALSATRCWCGPDRGAYRRRQRDLRHGRHSPSLIATLDGRWLPGKRVELGATLRHVGQSQLANDGSATQVLPAATLADLRASARFERFEVRGQLFNAFDADAYASGYTDGTSRYLFPVAERTFLATVVVKW
jgi:iron complex outermembrane receptor protein